MSRLDRTLAALGRRNEGAFMPFLVIDDPSRAQSLELSRAVIRAGADLVEYGLAFSDPPADGPAIQAAGRRARAAGATTRGAFEYLAQVRAETEIPIALLVYYNLILAQGVEAFYRAAHDAGVDAILVADLPVEESGPMVAAAKAHEIAPIFIASEVTSDRRLGAVLGDASGYLYLVARIGVTGTQSELDRGLDAVIERVKGRTDLPLFAGFGLSEPRHVEAVIRAGASGAISGSAIAKMIEERLDKPVEMLAAVEDFCRRMKAATIPSTRGAFRC